MALWAGRFSKEIDAGVNAFNSSIAFDARMYRHDIQGSIAHATMLGDCGIISKEDSKTIIEGLTAILADLDSGKLEFDPNAEDIHMFVEAELTKRYGDVGKRLHTSRSRNDQVALDLRLYLRDEIKEIRGLVEKLCAVLVKLAEQHTETVLPGYTHLQRAQPVTFAHHLLAYVQMLLRDLGRLDDTARRMNECPLGSGALAGTTYHIDREETASLLGFDAPMANSLDGVSDRDYCIELANTLSIIMMHLSRFSEEIILWCSWEFKFIELDDAFATGSSIMPQKKNPDIAELVRGKTGSVVGALMTMITMTKGLPLTYNRDLQEDKRPVMESMATVIASAQMMSKVISTTAFHKDRMLEVTSRGQINATDLADYLVTKGVPFREAHGIVGAAVRHSIDTGRNLEDMTLEELRQFSDRIEQDVYDVLPVVKCVERRNSYGGTSPQSTDVQISKAIEQIMLRDEVIRQENQLIENCWKALIE